MIENMRKNHKLSNLLNLFYISLLGCIVVMILNYMGLFNESNFAQKVVGSSYLLFGVISFSVISMCVIAYLGNLKEVYNAIWFGKIATLVVSIATAILLSKSVVTREVVNGFELLYTLVGVVVAMFLIKNADKK